MTSQTCRYYLDVVAADEDGGELYWRARFWRPSPFRRPLCRYLRRS